MPLDWIDVTTLSFNSLLLLERVQLSWLPGWLPERELAIALRANPAVAWFMRHKCPEIGGWVDQVEGGLENEAFSEREIRAAEEKIMASINDLLVYVVDPTRYDAQPFLDWDSAELTELLDWTGKRVIDVGSGTGRLALTIAPMAAEVFAVEPVGNLRRYITTKARRRELNNIFATDGIITDIPFPDDFADVTMGGHVFGDAPDEEFDELCRVTRPGGWVVLCPGSNDRDNDIHALLVERGCAWSRFTEPGDGIKRKYWLRLPAE